jgi:bacterioferritin-associated ferredoxin
LKLKAIINNSAMYVCLCKGVSERAVRASIREGARTLQQVGRACGAGTDCGACRGAVRDLLEEHEEEHEGLRVHLPQAVPA